MNTGLGPIIKGSVLVFSPLLFLFLFLFPPIRETISPILFGFVAAYILTPVVRFMNRYFRIPKTLSIIIIYVLFASIAIITISRSLTILNKESDLLIDESQKLSLTVNKNLSAMPEWSRGVASEIVNSVKETVYVKQRQPIPFIKGALGRTLGLLFFLVSTFYFLKDEALFSQILKKTTLGRTLHKTIQSYFRGQIFLIFFMTLITWIFLTTLHVKFALLLALFTGFAEVIPLVGPVTAATLTSLMAYLTGVSSFGLSSSLVVVVILIGYTVLRQIEDFFILPLVMERSVKLHPLFIILFTLLGERLFGFVGLLLAVPFAATYKVVLEYVWREYIKPLNIVN
jgi:predicted PurR-regulated permease PerM